MNERRKKHHSANKRNTVAVVAVLLVCILAIGGTIAYLTSHSELTNTFTVGQISPINPDGNGPGDTTIPDKDKQDESKLKGNLYEPSWVKDSKLLPSATIKKDPYVGVGAGSEACEVYVYVTNTMTNNNHIYFTINDGWEAVPNYATPIGATKNYTGGLFKYTQGLNALDVKDKNVWTTKPLFSNVVVANEAVAEDFKDEEGKVGSITVQSFLHQKNDADKQPIAEQTILDAVKKQFNLK